MLAVAGSGISSMSDASMPFQPAIDEPSNACPDVNLSSSNADTGTETCCSLPRVSVKRKSTNLISLSFTIFITSATVFAIKNLLAERECWRLWGSDSGQQFERKSPARRLPFEDEPASVQPACGRVPRSPRQSSRKHAIDRLLAAPWGAALRATAAGTSAVRA